MEKELDESNHMNAGTIQTLVSQNTKLLQMMEAHQTQTQAACHSNDNQNQKLEEIAKALHEVETGVSNPSNLLEKMKSRDEDLIAIVVANIGQMMSSQPFTASDKEKWAGEIDSIHQACNNIWNQIRDDNNAEETQKRYYDAQWRLGDVAEELARVNSELEGAMQWGSKQVEENNRLSLEVENLRGQVENLQKTVSSLQNASQEANQVSNEQAEMLEARLDSLQRKKDNGKQVSDQEVQRLKKALQEKDKNVKLAEEKRNIAEEQLDALRATFQQKEARLKSEHRAFEEELEESAEAKAELQSSLVEARTKIQRMSSDRQTTDVELEKLQKLVGNGSKTTSELKSDIQNSQKTQMFLAECLAEWTRDRNKLERLKTWKSEATEEAEEEPEANAFRPCSFQPAKTEPLKVRETERRVTLRSPQEDDPKGNPLSVMEERDARRQFDPPKSIMRVTRQTSKRLEAAKQTETAETLHFPPNVNTGRPADNDEEPAQNQAGTSALSSRRVVTTYSSYNRPVEGNSHTTSEQKHSVAQYNQDTELEEAVSHKGEAKRPNIVGKTSRSVPKHIPQAAGMRMDEVDSETTEEIHQIRMASDDLADRKTPSASSTQKQRARQQSGRASDLTVASRQRGGKDPDDARGDQDQIDSQASTQPTKASSHKPIPKPKADRQTSITSSSANKRRRA